jgi:hypothetical protein
MRRKAGTPYNASAMEPYSVPAYARRRSYLPAADSGDSARPSPTSVR